MNFYDALMQIIVFVGKAGIVVVAFALIALIIAFLSTKNSNKNQLKVEDLNHKFENYKDSLETYAVEKDLLKKIKKEEKAQKKIESKSTTPESSKPRLFVLDFDGDVKASAVESLREEISAILSLANSKDEALIRVESPGGVVHGYGLAASQIQRLRDQNLQVTVAVDKVAASGGYLMSVPAQKIIAAPFAILGSIGVVAQVPNLHRLLKKVDVDYREYTAGEFKRTVSLLGEITDKGEKKFLEQLEETHILFKGFVQKHRPNLKINEVATGEYWYGERALNLGLIDEIKTSDTYITEKLKSHKILSLKYEKKQAWNEKLTGVLGRSMARALDLVLQNLESRKIP